MKIYLSVIGLLIFLSCESAKTMAETETPAQDEKVIENITQNKLNGKWILDYMSPVNGKDYKKLFQIQKPYLTFVDEAKVAGNNGCNNIAGYYTTEDSKIHFDTANFRSTRMYCEGVDEEAFVSVLKTINGYDIINDGTKLVLLTGDIISMTLVKTED